MDDLSRSVAEQQLIGARRAAGYDRQLAPQVVVDPRPHRQVSLDRLRKRQQRRAESAVERGALFVSDPWLEADEVVSLSFCVRDRLGELSLWGQRRVRMRRKRQRHI